MDEIKTALKEARDALNNKDFEAAKKFSKIVLKKDKKNYMGLVILGVALQDSEQAPLAFKKAISLNSTKILAWQGLEKFYEKIDSPSGRKELIEIYVNLFPLEEDLNKLIDICNKFVSLASELGDVIKYGNILYDQYVSATVERKNVFFSSLIKLLLGCKLLSNDNDAFNLMQNVFDKHGEESLSDKFVMKYFEHLNLIKGFNEMFNSARDYLKSANIPDLKEFICKIYFEIVFLDDSTEINHSEALQFIEDHLNTIGDLGTLTKAGLHYQKMDYYNAYYISNTLYASDKYNYLLSSIVARCCLKLQRWVEAENISKKLITQSSKIISTNALKMLICSLCSQNNIEKCNNAFKLKSKLEANSLQEDEYLALFSAYMFTEKLDEAEACLNHLNNSPDFLPSKAKLLKKQGKIDQAFQILNENKEAFPSCWFELGLYYWEKNDYKKSLIPFMQAAKYNKHNCLVYLYLGEYNRLYDININKAKMCYQKAFALNPECVEAGKCLSYSYRYLQDWDANYNLLKSVTESNGSLDSWAWLSLGLHHLALEQWDNAIVSLRTFVRLNPNDAEAWESLADAYYSRGSLQSGLKCYQQAVSLDGKRKYSLVQIGTVQCLLGQFNEALITYKSNDDDQFLPALLGMAEVKLCIANEKFSQNLFGCCRDSAQEAIDLVTAAVLKEHRFVCLWKMLSSAISIIARLPPKYRWLFINSKFHSENNSDKLVMLTEANVFNLAINCLCKAISLSTKFYSYLYHELAIVYLDYYKSYGNQKVALKAYAAIRKCLSAEQNVWQYWITLGVISMSKGVRKYDIAQHAFIQALNLDETNSIIWCNLGFIYLFFHKNKVANRYFQKAQQFDPSHLHSWIGQALIAESVTHEDAMDLFRHSTELGFHKESSMGYAEWVCKTLRSTVDSKQTKMEYFIKNMHAVPMACDLMTWLTEYETESAYCLNIFGLLSEKMGLFKQAVSSYERALKLVDVKNKNIVQMNYGRVLYHVKRYDDAIEVFKSVSGANLHSACGLALSLYKCENYEESFALYSTSLQWLANNDREKSELLVAMASMAYKFQGIDDCKTLLFQSVQLNKEFPSVSGLLAIYSIGLLHSEQGLSNLVIDELRKLSDMKECYNFIGFFESYLLLKSQKPVEAIKKIISYIHKYPDNMYFWQRLSGYCLTESSSNMSLASKSAQKVILSGEEMGNIQCYRVASIAEMYLNNLKSSVKLAQRAVHMCPDNADNWALLLSALSPKLSTSHINWCKKLLTYIKNHLNPSKPISNWLSFFERHYIISL